jgi:WD40 repeat protein
VLAVCSDLKNQFVTSGNNHLKFWSLSGRSFVCNNYNFGLLAGVNQVFICSKYVDSGLVVTGTQEGSIYVWTKDGTLIHIVQKDQAHMDCEVFDLCVPPIDLTTSVFHVLSGGADRRAIVWEFRLNDDGNLFHKKLFHKKMHAEYGR